MLELKTKKDKFDLTKKKKQMSLYHEKAELHMTSKQQAYLCHAA